MKRVVLRSAVAPSCVLLLILVAAACGGSAGSDITDPFVQGDASSTSSSGTSGSTTSGQPDAASGGIPDAGDDDDASVLDASLPDASQDATTTPVDAGADASDAGGGGIGIYVSATIGQAGNPGTKAAPLKTIAEGIANAVTLGGPQTVLVAEGHYAEKVTLVEGISLLGGHQCSAASCTWTQNATLYDSSIDNTDAEGVLAGKTISRLTKVEGFRIRGKDGSPGSNPSAAGVTIDGGALVLRGNTIIPGAVNGASGRAVGVVVIGPPLTAAGPLIDANSISGGSGSNVWVGIALDRKAGAAASAVAQITRNSIKGGTAPTSVGIAAGSSLATTTIFNNDILAGTSTGGGGSWGIQVSSALTIDRNRINVDTANAGTCLVTAVCGGIISQSSTTTITNNVVFGVRAPRSAAVLLAEAEGPPGPVVLNGNYLDGAGLGLLTSAGNTISAAVWLRICQGTSCGVNAVLGRLRNDIFAGGVNENRYGIYEEQIALRTAHPDKLDSNDFFFSPVAGRKDNLYHFWNGTAATDLKTTATIASTVPTTPAPSNLYNLDPLINNTFHLADTSPLIDKGTMTDAALLDLDGETRPKNNLVDIGPDEAK